MGGNEIKVCILTAGKGSRSGRWGEHLHKALIPVGSKPALSWIVESFPEGMTFVIALGFRSDQVRQFLTTAYPRRRFEFVHVDQWEGEGSGPGYSLYCCKQRLQSPFIFTACDTIVPSNIPETDRNWMGVHDVERPEDWCMVSAGRTGRISEIHYRTKADTRLAFIGIAGIKDHVEFWESLGRDRSLLSGEYQVINGMNGLIDRGLFAELLPWHDTGTEANWRKAVSDLGDPFNALGKNIDTTYKVEGSIVKFFADPGRASRRAQRAVLLDDLVPEVTASNGHFLKYEFAQGQPLSQVLTEALWEEFLSWCADHLWTPIVEAEDDISFSELSLAFYKDKTERRLADFFSQRSEGSLEGVAMIDGERVPAVREQLASIDWGWMASGTPSRFHGDLHPDNVLFTGKPGMGRFLLIDWREDFGGSIVSGDVDYDLAKLRHTLLFSVEQMESEAFGIERSGDSVRIALSPSPFQVDLNIRLSQFIEERGFDRRRVDVVTGLVFINMAPLYADPLGEFLYWLGRKTLGQSLK
jgi:choline kinase